MSFDLARHSRYTAPGYPLCPRCAYDLSGLVSARRLGLDLSIVVLDNDGGGIFEFLPVAGARDAFEEHIATPPGLDLPALAAAFGLPYMEARALDDLLKPGLVHVRTDRRANVDLHRRTWSAVAANLNKPKGV